MIEVKSSLTIMEKLKENMDAYLQESDKLKQQYSNKVTDSVAKMLEENKDEEFKSDSQKNNEINKFNNKMNSFDSYLKDKEKNELKQQKENIESEYKNLQQKQQELVNNLETTNKSMQDKLKDKNEIDSIRKKMENLSASKKNI